MKRSDIKIIIQSEQKNVGLIYKRSGRKHKIIFNENKENIFHYRVMYQIPINIKLFYGQNENDIIHNRNYTIYRQDVFLNERTLTSIIKKVTNNKYIIHSLICEIQQYNNNYHGIIYQNIQNMYNSQDVKDISTLIAGYVIENKWINISPFYELYGATSFEGYNIPPDATIILRKNSKCKYIEYDTIDANETMKLIIYVYTNGRNRSKDLSEEYSFNVFATFQDFKDLLQNENILNGDIKDYYWRCDGRDLPRAGDKKLIDYGIFCGTRIFVYPRHMDYGS